MPTGVAGAKRRRTGRAPPRGNDTHASTTDPDALLPLIADSPAHDLVLVQINRSIRRGARGCRQRPRTFSTV